MAILYPQSESDNSTLNLDYTPSSTQIIVASTGITANMITNKVIRVVGNTGDVEITATPSIVAGFDGQEIDIEGTDETDTVTLQDESILAGSHLSLTGDITLGKNDNIKLRYNQSSSRWVEICRSNNIYTPTA